MNADFDGCSDADCEHMRGHCVSVVDGHSVSIVVECGNRCVCDMDGNGEIE